MSINTHLLKDISPESYATAKPFPHVVIDGLLSEDGLRAVQEEFPKMGSKYWCQPDNPGLTVGKHVGRGSPTLGHMPEQTRAIVSEMYAPAFLGHLERLTGVNNLAGDPAMDEGGFHCVTTGGYLKAHADFSDNGRIGKARRVNLLLYLNDDWNEEWGGHLELFDESVKSIVKVSPTANKAVIFNTSKTSYHGHPHPLKCPVDRCRKSLAVYFYTPFTEGMTKHSVIFPKAAV